MRSKKDIMRILISMSNNLDIRGFHSEANNVDFLIRKVAEDLASDLEEEYSESQIKNFDADGNGKPFEKEDFKLLRNKKKAKFKRKNRLK